MTPKFGRRTIKSRDNFLMMLPGLLRRKTREPTFRGNNEEKDEGGSPRSKNAGFRIRKFPFAAAFKGGCGATAASTDACVRGCLPLWKKAFVSPQNACCHHDQNQRNNRWFQGVPTVWRRKGNVLLRRGWKGEAAVPIGLPGIIEYQGIPAAR